MTSKIKFISIFLTGVLYVSVSVPVIDASTSISDALKLSDVKGESLSLSVPLKRYHGDTENILGSDTELTLGVFWASWCVPCREEFPQLQTLHEKFSDSGLRIVGINVEESSDTIEGFLNKYPVDFQIYLDQDRQIHKKVDDSSFFVLPAGFVHDGQTVLGTFTGARDFQNPNLHSAINRVLRRRNVDA